MKRVECDVTGYPLGFEQAKSMARVVAEDGNEYASLVSWCDRKNNLHSPHCLQCEIKGEPAWEIYGRNHEGRLRISFNEDTFVFIYS